MERRGLSMIWRLCPMRLNWQELPDTVRYCTDRGIELFYNQLDSPVGLSLTTLPAPELAHVVDTLEVQEPSLVHADCRRKPPELSRAGGAAEGLPADGDARRRLALAPGDGQRRRQSLLAQEAR
jgi:hypothetical protein